LNGQDPDPAIGIHGEVTNTKW